MDNKTKYITIMQWIIIFFVIAVIPQFAYSLPNVEETKKLIKKAETYDNDSEMSKIQFAIGMIESSFGDPAELIGDNNHSFGIFQIQVPTAKDVAKHHNIPLPPTNGEIRSLLIEDEALVVLLNRLLLKDLIMKYHDLKLGVIAYNQGEGAVDMQLRNNFPIAETYYNRFRKYYQNAYKIDIIPSPKPPYYVDDQGFIVGSDDKTILVVQ